MSPGGVPQCDHLGMESQNSWAGKGFSGSCSEQGHQLDQGLRDSCSQSGASVDCMLIYANCGYPQATAGEETAQRHLLVLLNPQHPLGSLWGNRGAGCGPA